MTRRLVLAGLALTLVVLVALEVPLAVTYARTERQNLTAKVERDAVALASIAQAPLGGRGGAAALGPIAEDYAARTGGRVVVVDRSGTALVDTSPLFAEGRELASRPELAAALAGQVASGIRRSETLGTRLLYVALPVASGGDVLGAVRITYPTSELDERVTRYRLILLAIAAVVLLAAAVVGFALAGWIARPLEAVRRAATRAGEGDLAARAPVGGPPEVRDLAQALNETVAKLELLVASQSSFVADASHQLRTPLTSLRLRLENLEPRLDEEGRAALAAAAAEVDRLGRTVDELLALARADASEAPARPVDARALLDGRVEAWTPLAEERGVRIAADADGAGRLRAAPERLEQVLDNLLANALDVSPAGATVRLEARRGPGWVELHVLDEGPGLSEEERARAFDRFWRAGDGDGSGLGLAIVRRLVAADDGEVELREAPGGGVDAVVRLRAA